MKIITGTNNDVRKSIDGVYQRIAGCNDQMKRYVLIDYLIQLHDLEAKLTGRESKINYDRAFQSEDESKDFALYIKNLFKKTDDKFINLKSRHVEFFDEMLYINDIILEDYFDVTFASNYQKMSIEEFCQYFYEFLREYNLESSFDKFIEDRRIFNCYHGEANKHTGFVIYDPTKKKSSIILCEAIYNVPYLLTLGHEFGHTYDLSKFSKSDYEGYMKYSYSSVYLEVISSVFEKLFYDFLFKMQYRINEVKEIYSEFLFENKNFVMDSYILSLLDNDTIRKLPYNIVSTRDIVKQVEGKFELVDDLFDHLYGRKIDAWKTPLYSYGDYISTILKEGVHKEGLDNPMMREFFNMRTVDFNFNRSEEMGFSLEEYHKIYKKDVSRLKK